jgi:hypothetical protein
MLTFELFSIIIKNNGKRKVFMLFTKEKIIIISLFILSVCIWLQCVPKSEIEKKKFEPDENFAISSVANIDSLLGFSFEWNFRRENIGLLPKLSAKLEGKVSLPDKIYMNGRWNPGEVSEEINCYYVQGKEYTYNSRKNQWEGSSEISFPNPLKQLKLVLSFGDFDFVDSEDIGGTSYYVFSFKPNIYFLDPVEATKPEGLLWLSKRNGFPLRVKVESEKGQIEWDMRLSHFNRFTGIDVPFIEQHIKIEGIAANEEDINKIIERFKSLGYSKAEIVLGKNSDVLLCIKAERLDDSLILNLLQKGELEFFTGKWPKHPIYKLKKDNQLVKDNYGEEARLFFERGVVTKPVIAVDRIFTSNVFSRFDLKNDMLGDYSIYGTIKSEERDSLSKIVSECKEQPVVMVVDDRAISIQIVRDAWLVDNKIPIVKGLKARESFLLYTKLNSGTLKKSYTYKYEE